MCVILVIGLGRVQNWQVPGSLGLPGSVSGYHVVLVGLPAG